MSKHLFNRKTIYLKLLSFSLILFLSQSKIYAQCSAPPVYTSVGGNSAVLCEGGSMTPFTLNFTGATSFQWQRTPLSGAPNYTNVSGQTTNTLSLTNITKADEGTYRLVATNACGSTNSANTFQLQVRLKPVIVTQPLAAVQVCQGNNLRLSLSISGNANSLAWYKDDVLIPGQTTINLTISNFQSSNAGQYHAVIQPVPQCAGFTATSSKSSVSLASNLAFATEPPASQNICAGSNLVLAPTITGTATSYQWRREGGNIGGQTNSTYSLNNVDVFITGNYSVVITGTCNTLTSGNYAVSVSPNASISVNPTSVTKCVGENHTLSAFALGASRVEWLKNSSVITDGGNISGATTNSLTITNICSTCDAGTYALRAYGNGACSSQSVTSNTATLSLNEPINIVSSTSSLSKCEGENVSLEVTATGSITGYQWKKGGNNISGATSSTLQINNITTADAAEYTVEIFGPCGNQTSSGISLNVATTKASITLNPIDGAKCVGETHTFTASANTASSYQWQKDGVDLTDGGNISGSNSASLIVSNLCLSCDAGTYSVKAFGTGSCSSQSVISSNVILTINTPISISSYTAPTTKCETENLTLEVVANGTITGYQWKKAGNAISGQTSSSLVLTNLSTADAAEYSVDIFGPCGTVSQGGINVGVNLKPSINTNPIDQAKCIGETASFSGTATNVGSYQWMKGGSNLSDGGNISGATTNSLSISNVCVSCDAGSYTLKVFGPGACSAVFATTTAATLTVNTPISISSYTAPTTKCENENLTLEVVAIGTITGYQWKKAGNAISGQTSSSLVLSNLSTADAAEYSVDIFGPCGTVSQGGINVGVNLKPIINTNPIDQAKCIGETASFSGTATNVGSYQWMKGGSNLSDGGNISGATTNNLSISNVCVSCDAGTYTLKVFGPGACSAVFATTTAATLTVNTPISISSYTAPTTKCETENLTLEVVANGTITGYQWKKAGNAISGQTSSSLVLSNLSTADAAEYSVDIFGPCGTVSQGGINVGVNLKPIINTNPIDQAKCIGETASFSGTATNVGSYQWMKGGSNLSDGGNISGATTNSLSISNVCVSCDAGTYTLKVFGPGACSAVFATTTAATLTVYTPISISSYTAPITKCENDNLTLEVVANGTITGYQWKKAGNAISGQTSSSLVLSNLSTADAAEYSVDIFGPCGTVSQGGINVGVNLKPIINTNPIDQAKCIGETASFSGTATNVGSYQWMKGGSNLSDGGNISGATTNSLSISNVCVSCDAGTYTLKVFGPGACSAVFATTTAATLTVNTPISISSHTVSTTKCETENLTLEVVANGTITGYQWKKAGNAISGQTSSSLVLSNLSTADAAEYSVDIFGPCGTVSQGGINVGVNLKPIINTNLIDQAKCIGETASFSGTATNVGSYQWMKGGSNLSDGGNISGATTNSLSISNVCVSCDAGTYTLKVFGPGACSAVFATTTAATLTVNTPISISSYTAPITKCENDNLTLEVVANGTITGYQWKKAGNAISGQTSSSLVLSNLSTADAAEYSVDIFGPCGTVSQGGINVGVNLKPIINTNPIDQAKCIGETASFSGTATNVGSYQWMKGGSNLSDGGNISGATTNSLSISNVCVSCDAGTYTLKVFGQGACSAVFATTTAATLTVNTPISISSYTAPITKCENENLTLEVVANGTITGYQWKKAGNAISGQTSSSLVLSNLSTADAAEYSVDIIGPCGTVSQGGINVGVNLKPSFSLEPKSVSKCVTETIKFEVNVLNSSNIFWQKDGVDLVEGGTITGTKTNILTIENICSTCDRGNYQVVALGTGVCASYTTKSAEAVLTINELITKVNLPTFPEVCEGANTGIEVSFDGIALGYQWYKNGFKLNNNVGKKLNLLNVKAEDSGNYSVEIFGPCGSVISKTSELKVTPMPKITKTTENIKACIGENINLEISGTNFGNITWFKDGFDLKVNSLKLNINAITEANSGQYIAYVEGQGVCSGKNVSSNFIKVEGGSKITIEKNVKPVTCFGLNDGSIQIKTSGGFGSPYSISWQNPAGLKAESINNLFAGLYEYTVADSKGCLQKDSVRITQPEKLVLSLVSKTQNYCENSGKAILKTSATGGLKPYKVSWNDIPSIIDFERQNLKAGNYTIKVIDANNCEANLLNIVEDSTAKMAVKLSYTQPTCFGKADAKLTLTTTSGKAPYIFKWTGLSNTVLGSEISNLAVNNETAQAIVTDALGCEVKTDIVKLISPVANSLNITKQKEVCPSKAFEINGTVADGVKYEWLTPKGNKLQGAIITGDSIGRYKLSVTNTLGCVAIDSVSIVPNSNVKPFFASPTQAPVNSEVVFVDLTNPLASNVKWIYPNTAKMIVEDATKLKLSFSATGIYKISSQVTVSDCIYNFSKNVSIVDKVDDGEFKPPFGYDNLDFTVLSNPITQGFIGLKLGTNHPKKFTVSLISLNGVQTLFKQEVENQNDDTFFFEVPSNLSSTSYLVTIENGLSKKAKRVIILN